jgi:hypothetical protein
MNQYFDRLINGGMMKCVTIIADDKVGLLADMSYVLSKAKINIESINVDVVAGKAIISTCLSDADKGKKVLEQAGYTVEEMNAVVIKLADEPGQLNKITTMLSKEGINIQNVHMLSKDNSTTALSIIVDKPKRASTLLKEFLITKDSSY